MAPHAKQSKVPSSIQSTEKACFMEEKSFECNLVQKLYPWFRLSLSLESYHYIDALFLRKHLLFWPLSKKERTLRYGPFCSVWRVVLLLQCFPIEHVLICPNVMRCNYIIVQTRRKWDLVYVKQWTTRWRYCLYSLCIKTEPYINIFQMYIFYRYRSIDNFWSQSPEKM